ncbi:restriction endonuclease subunit S [Psychrobacter sp. NG27]|uniref:restriction endonuclease subunit S n=1 Tax=Psychrobacter sp. NG27 TaxID=2781966 RepID=UPI0018DFB6AD|nr:restriction endonuclease subunit S [Psychrobacter sp. NG27]MBI0427292.1 restriction endonuclease subunit S [Psychrobacter sp. NG27]
MVPNGWEVKSFAKLLISGDMEKIQDGNHGDSHPKSSDFVKSGIPFVMARDLKKGTVDLENCAYITKEQADSLRIGFAKTGDILLSHKGTVGLVAIVPLCDEYMMLTPQVTYYRIPQDSSLMSSYLYQFLLSHEYQSRFKNLAFQSTRSYLGITAQKELSINLPPLPEQQKIAKILSTCDKAISTTERLIENSTQQKKALMQQLLTGKKRLLDESGKRFEGEWEDVKLSAIVKVIGGNAFKSTDFKDSGIPLIKISNIKPDYSVSIESSVFISLDQKYDKFQIKNGDVLIAMSGATTGKIGRYTSDEMAYLNQRVGRFDVRKGLTINSYLFQLLKLPKVQHEILIDAVGGAQPNISNKDIERIKVSIPPIKEQQKVATVLTNADKEIELLEQQLADFQQEKKALMQVLLTGKKRVVVDG